MVFVSIAIYIILWHEVIEFDEDYLKGSNSK